MGKIYEGVKAVPTAIYQMVGSAAIIAFATFMATKPSELEKKVVGQTVIVHPSSGGGSYGKAAICPPVMPNYKFSFEEK